MYNDNATILMNHQPKKNGRKTIYYDGSCPMCVSIIKKVDGSTQKEKFNPKDITKDKLPQNITKTAAEKEIHVVDENGKIYKNAEAILKILEEYPKWKLLVKIGRLPIIKQLLPVGYKLVASHRHSIFNPAKGKDLNVFIAFIFVYVLIVFPLALFTKEEIFPFSRFPMYAQNSLNPCGYRIYLSQNNLPVTLDSHKATNLFLRFARNSIAKHDSSSTETCKFIREVFWPKKIPHEGFYVTRYCADINNLPSLIFGQRVVLSCQ